MFMSLKGVPKYPYGNKVVVANGISFPNRYCITANLTSPQKATMEEDASAIIKTNRKRKAGNDGSSKRTSQNDTYSHISFCKRSSSERPGSPHRFFYDSFAVVEIEASPSVVDHSALQSSTTSKNATQIVHRHLNGLCIVTAGNILQHLFTTTSSGNNNDNNANVSVSSVRYHVNASNGAQSARGKIRARKNKNKLSKDDGANNHAAFDSSNCDLTTDVNVDNNALSSHDGNVHPDDALCTITMSNGVQVGFKCCVSGTVLELNPRLAAVSVDSSGTATTSGIIGRGGEQNTKSQSNSNIAESMSFKEDGRGEIMNNAVQTKDNEVVSSSSAPMDPSLVLTDPLLDGYLAVILPRGPFPPKNSV